MPSPSARPRSRRFAAVPLALVALLVGCSGDDSADGTRAAADSIWTLADSPAVEIGQVEGDAAYLFAGITGAAMLPDDRIVVADAGSGELRFFDADDGSFIVRAGGSGEAPGEFGFLGKLWLHHDTIVTVDAFARRIQLFHADGRFARLARLEAVGDAFSNPIGQLADGTIISFRGSRGFSPEDVGQRIEYELRFTAHDAEGGLRRPITDVPGADRWGLRAGGTITFPYLPFAQEPVYAVGRDGLVIAEPTDPVIRLHSADGSVSRRYEFPDRPRPVTDADIERYREYRLEAASDANARRRVNQFLAEAPIAERMPLYQSVLLDDLGNLWIESYRPAWEEGRGRWHVFAASGQRVATVRTPADFRPFDIGDGFVLGVARDELGVEYVRLYALTKSSG